MSLRKVTQNELRKLLNTGELDFPKLDLSKLDFREKSIGKYEGDLARADFTFSNLKGTNFMGTSLWKADLRGANLDSTNFKGADLTDAFVYKKDLKNAIKDKTTTMPNGKPWHPESNPF